MLRADPDQPRAYPCSAARVSVSTNMRLITASNLAEQVSLPGDRRNYYRFGPDTWERALTTEIDGIIILRRIGERGLAAARASESTARDHLEGLLEFCDLLIPDRRATVERWRVLKESRRTGHAPTVDDTPIQKRA